MTFCRSCGHDEGCAHAELAESEAYYEVERAAAEAARVRNAEYLLSIESYPPQKLRERIESMERESAALRERAEKAELAAAWTADQVELAGTIEAVETVVNESGVDFPDEPSAPLAARVGLLVSHLRERAEEREMDMHSRIRAGYDKTVADCWRAKVAGLEARLARYEAPGPALLTAPTGQGETGKMLEALVGGAYREQHARCVAVVERMRTGSLRDYEREMLDEVISALTDEAEK